MKLWHHIVACLAHDQPCVLVRITQTKGSVPRSVGAGLVVRSDGGFHGTIGGGRLEWEALQTALQMLTLATQPGTAGRVAKSDHLEEFTYPLGPNLGQCCGGSVTLSYEVCTPDMLPRAQAQAAVETEPRIPVILFGAGHVGKAMALTFGLLPITLDWVDSRNDIFPNTMPVTVTPHLMPDPASILAGKDRDTAILILTHSHSLDLEILSAALAGAFGFIGLIGSKTKRQRFVSQLQKAGFGEDVGARFHCPIGIDHVPSKQPAVIAASVAAQILREKSHFLSD